jgi:very-short-patch-repair endonuclease
MEKRREYAKTLRGQQTREELRLWYLLRGRRFSRYKFRRQHVVGNYILDFACCEARLAIELDGGQHLQQEAYDQQRTEWLALKGWRVLRFWNNELNQDEEAVLRKIFDTLQTLLPSPRPSP